MRIAEIHWAFPPTIGGVETHLAILGPALVQRGHAVSLLTGQPGDQPEESVVGGMRVRRTPYLDLNRMSPESFAAQAKAVARTIHAFLDQVRPDVIHLHNLHYFSEVPLEAVLLWRRQHPCALVLTAHNTWDDLRYHAMARHAEAYDAVIAVSRHIQEELARVGYPRSRLRVVHHGVTEDWLTAPRTPHPELARLADRPIIFHPARLGLAKGSLVVVEAFQKVHQQIPEAFLLLAGSAQIVDWGSVQHRELRLIQDRIRTYGLAESMEVRTFGWPEIRQAYDAASVLVYPSVAAEPFGIAVIEAMARQRPTVVSRVGGMPEIVRHGRDGWVVPPGDADALAHAIVTLLSDRALAESLGWAARQRVADRFTAAQMVEETEQVLAWARAAVASGPVPVPS